MELKKHIDHHTEQSKLHRENVSNLYKQMVDLDQRLRDAKNESELKDQAFDREIMIQARAQAQEVVELMDTMLPRELIEMVYLYLTARDSLQCFSDTFPYCLNHGSYGTILPPPPPPPPINPTYPYSLENTHAKEYICPVERIFSADYVSRNFASEVSKAYYRENKFLVNAHQSMDSLRNLLEHDRAGLSFTPAHYIRDIRIEIPVECCEVHRCRPRPPPRSDDTTRNRLKEFSTNFRNCLGLLPEDRMTQVKVDIVMIYDYRNHSQSDDPRYDRLLLNMLYSVRRSVYYFWSHKTNTTILARMARGREVDISHIFPEPSADWDEEHELPYVPKEPMRLSAAGTEEAVELQQILADAKKFWGYSSFFDLVLKPSLDGQPDWVNEGRYYYPVPPPPPPPYMFIRPPIPIPPPPLATQSTSYAPRPLDADWVP